MIWRNVYVDGQNSAGTIWGSVTDLTFAYNLVKRRACSKRS